LYLFYQSASQNTITQLGFHEAEKNKGNKQRLKPEKISKRIWVSIVNSLSVCYDKETKRGIFPAASV